MFSPLSHPNMTAIRANEPIAGTLGHSVPRIEDRRLLRGTAAFVDDIRIAGTLHATFVRSAVAHALLMRVDVAAARRVPGVHAVLTYADLRPLMTCDRIPLAVPAAAIRFDVEPVVACRPGSLPCRRAVCIVVADSRRIAEDAARAGRDRLRAAAGGGRSGDGGRARRAAGRGSTARTIWWRSTAIEYGDIDGCLRPRGAAHSPRASVCTRAAATRSSRAACWPARSGRSDAAGDAMSHGVGRHPDAASRQGGAGAKRWASPNTRCG